MIEPGCEFCPRPPTSLNTPVVHPRFWVRLADVPEAKGHALIVPKTHITSVLDLEHKETLYLGDAIQATMMWQNQEFTPDGFDVKVHYRTPPIHLTIHVVPRYEGDRPAERYLLASGQEKPPLYLVSS